jgi:hypothetical protein
MLLDAYFPEKLSAVKFHIIPQPFILYLNTYSSLYTEITLGISKTEQWMLLKRF